jgi:hypothetical protein
MYFSKKDNQQQHSKNQKYKSQNTNSNASK